MPLMPKRRIPETVTLFETLMVVAACAAHAAKRESARTFVFMWGRTQGTQVFSHARADGGWQMADGGWQMADGGWQTAGGRGHQRSRQQRSRQQRRRHPPSDPREPRYRLFVPCNAP